VAWMLELLKLFLSSGLRRMLMLGFVLAGLTAHTLYLGYRAVEFSATPLSSSFDWCLVAAWLLVVSYLYLSFYFPKAALGLYMLPMAMALVVTAAFADRTPYAAGDASRVWGIIHGVALMLGTLAVMVGFVAGLMYLLQSYRLKHKLSPSPGFRLPALEWLEKVNSRVIILSSMLIGIGFVAGILLNTVSRGDGAAVPWSDPVIWSSALMFGWVSAAALFNVAYRPARRGRKVAYLTVVSFVFLVLTLGIFLLVDSEHGGNRRSEQGGYRRAGAAVAVQAEAPALALARGEARS
jgi:ABC-type transport system involved in cytochrome c biogenesis permease subunit